MSVLVYILAAVALLVILSILRITTVLQNTSAKIVHKTTGKPIPVHPWYKTWFPQFLYRFFVLRKSSLDVQIEDVNNAPDIIGNYFSGELCVTVTEPNAIQTVLAHTAFDKLVREKSRSRGRFQELFEDSIFYATGEDALKKRRELNPAFKYSSIQSLTPLFVTVAQEMLNQFEKLDLNKSFDIEPWLTKMTFDAIGKSGFGYDFHSLTHPNQEQHNFERTLSGIIDPVSIVLGSFGRKLPLKSNIEYNKASSQTRKLVLNVINKRQEVMKKKQEGGAQEITPDIEGRAKDLLDLILEVDPSQQINVNQILSNIFLFFLAGHETSAATLTAAIFYLGKYPEYQEKAYKEIKSALELSQQTSEEHNDKILLPESVVKDIPYINAIIKESMRMNVAIPLLAPRISTKDTEIMDYVIPKGTPVHINIVAAHYHPKYWKNPTKFDPERFLSGDETKNQIFSFATGPRICIGNKFAMLEMHVTLAMLIYKYKWTLDRSSEWKTKLFSLTSRPQGGMKIKLEKRTN